MKSIIRETEEDGVGSITLISNRNSDLINLPKFLCPGTTNKTGAKLFMLREEIRFPAFPQCVVKKKLTRFNRREQMREMSQKRHKKYVHQYTDGG